MRLGALIATATCAIALAGCGNKHETVTLAETEGIYVDVGPLTYQVQLSRQLNPTSVEDRAYLEGVPPAQLRLAGGQTWFGVFLRAKNETAEAAVSAADITITDTLENVYRPVLLDRSNVFAYRPENLSPEEVLPAPDSPSASGPIQGSLLLFKLPLDSFQNRPLELRIRSAEDQAEAIVDLDV